MKTTHRNSKKIFFFLSLLLTVLVSSCKSPLTTTEDSSNQQIEMPELSSDETWHPSKSEPNVNDIRIQAWEEWHVVPVYNVFTQENGSCTLQSYLGITDSIPAGANWSYVDMFPKKKSSKYGIAIGEPSGITDCNQKSYVEEVNYDKLTFMADQNDTRISSERPVIMYNLFIIK